MDAIEHYAEHPKRAEAMAALAKVRNDSNDCACDGCLVDAVLEAIAPHNPQGAVSAGWALSDAIVTALRSTNDEPDPQALWQAVEAWQADAPERGQ